MTTIRLEILALLAIPLATLGAARLVALMARRIAGLK